MCVFPQNSYFETIFPNVMKVEQCENTAKKVHVKTRNPAGHHLDVKLPSLQTVRNRFLLFKSFTQSLIFLLYQSELWQIQTINSYLWFNEETVEKILSNITPWKLNSPLDTFVFSKGLPQCQTSDFNSLSFSWRHQSQENMGTIVFKFRTLFAILDKLKQ